MIGKNIHNFTYASHHQKKKKKEEKHDPMQNSDMFHRIPDHKVEVCASSNPSPSSSSWGLTSEYDIQTRTTQADLEQFWSCFSGCAHLAIEFPLQSFHILGVDHPPNLGQEAVDSIHSRRRPGLNLREAHTGCSNALQTGPNPQQSHPDTLLWGPWSFREPGKPVAIPHCSVQARVPRTQTVDATNRVL